MGLCVVSSVAISIIGRANEKRRIDRQGALVANYIAATVLSVAFALALGGGMPAPRTLLIGAATGACYYVSFYLYLLALGRIGIGLSIAAMRLQLVAPAFAGFLAYGERPGALQWLGIALACLAVPALAMALGGSAQPNEEAGRTSANRALLLGLFAVCCGNALLVQAMGAGPASLAERAWFLAATFGSAGIVPGWLFLLRGREAITDRATWIGGVALGIPNYFSSWFLLVALTGMASGIAWGISNTATLATGWLVGVLAYGERPGKWGYAGIALALVAVLLLAITRT